MVFQRHGLGVTAGKAWGEDWACPLLILSSYCKKHFCTAIYVVADDSHIQSFFPSLVHSEIRLEDKMEAELDFKEILKVLLQQLINSNFIQNFHKVQVHFQHSITPLFF